MLLAFQFSSVVVLLSRFVYLRRCPCPELEFLVFAFGFGFLIPSYFARYRLARLRRTAFSLSALALYLWLTRLFRRKKNTKNQLITERALLFNNDTKKIQGPIAPLNVFLFIQL